jgi:hypothetical protein
MTKGDIRDTYLRSKFGGSHHQPTKRVPEGQVLTSFLIFCHFYKYNQDIHCEDLKLPGIPAIDPK